jgi:MoaA/NifB/PqqE/SkfB family radical SAM enzyme
MNVLVHKFGHRLQDAVKRIGDVRSYDPNSPHPRLRGPREVHIQTVDRCDAGGVMGPCVSGAKTPPVNVMDDSLYRQILDESNRFGTVRRVRLMLQNEPLFDHKLPDRARLARKLLGRSVRILAVTNGAPLTTAMIDELADSGIDLVSVSIDAACEDTYSRIHHGLSFQHAVQNTLALIERLGPRRVGVKFLLQRENEGEQDAFASYWLNQGVSIKFARPVNHADPLDSNESIGKQRPDFATKLLYSALNRFTPACPLPFYATCVLWDGRVITCCNDWGPRDTAGDLSTQTLEQVWRGERMKHYRHPLRTHRTQEGLVCAGCSLAERFWNL